jgi:hypothetical protein
VTGSEDYRFHGRQASQGGGEEQRFGLVMDVVGSITDRPSALVCETALRGRGGDASPPVIHPRAPGDSVSPAIRRSPYFIIAMPFAEVTTQSTRLEKS